MTLQDLPVLLASLGSWLAPRARRLAVPVLGGLAVAAASVALDMALEEQESRQVWHVVESETQRVRSDMADGMNTRVNALRDLALDWERSAVHDNQAWEAASAPLLSRDLQFRALVWMDSAQRVRGVVPSEAGMPGGVFDDGDEEARQQVLSPLLGTGDPAISRSIMLSNGARQLICLEPTKPDGRTSGYVLGIVRVRDLIDALARDAIIRGYEVAIFEGPFQLYGPVWDAAGDNGTWSVDESVDVGGLSWRVKIWPSEDLLATLLSRAPKIALGSGLCIALLLAMALYFAQTWKRRALEAATAPAEPLVHRLDAEQHHDDEDHQPDQSAIEEPEHSPPSR